ncbi:MAG TPA: hypothetical protein VGO57_14535 [Verrucomicrobiae bacterium]|jgi:hypothetical protein
MNQKNVHGRNRIPDRAQPPWRKTFQWLAATALLLGPSATAQTIDWYYTGSSGGQSANGNSV